MSNAFTSALDSPTTFPYAPGEKETFFFVVPPDFVWRRAEEKFTQSEKRAEKKDPAVKAPPGSRERSTRLPVSFGGVQGGHLRQKLSFDGF